jgi:hypothetical protein
VPAGFSQYLSCFGLFWDPVANIIPAKRYFEGLTAKYFSRENICVYGSTLLGDFHKKNFFPLRKR